MPGESAIRSGQHAPLSPPAAPLANTGRTGNRNLQQCRSHRPRNHLVPGGPAFARSCRDEREWPSGDYSAQGNTTRGLHRQRFHPQTTTADGASYPTLRGTWRALGRRRQVQPYPSLTRAPSVELAGLEAQPQAMLRGELQLGPRRSRKGRLALGVIRGQGLPRDQIRKVRERSLQQGAIALHP